MWTPSRIKKQNLSKGGGAPCEPTDIRISYPTVCADVLLQVGYLFFLDWWQELHSGHHKTFHSAKNTKNAKKTENPLCGSASCASALRRAAHQMTGFGTPTL